MTFGDWLFGIFVAMPVATAAVAFIAATYAVPVLEIMHFT